MKFTLPTFTIILILASETASYAQLTEINITAEPAWSPYLVGALIGVLSWLTFYFSDRPIGASSAYAKFGGLLGRKIAPQHTMKTKYFNEKNTTIDWEVMLVGFVILGAFLAAWSGGELTGRFIPPLWDQHFGDSHWLRFCSAFAGGILLSLGARLAGGCTSGHGISGALQLSVGSWIAVICFFAGGVLTAFLMYRI